MTAELMQCREAATPSDVGALFVAGLVILAVMGVLLPWLGLAFERYFRWVMRKAGGGQ